MEPLIKPHLHNLPTPLSTFIGRAREVEEVRQLLSIHRLVTLTGPGGCGKTRLALKVAHELLEEFEDGVLLIELASLAEPTLVPQAVASVVGVHEQSGKTLIEALSHYLLSRHLLLVIDNCEHLITACAQLVETLSQQCPNLRVLATGREMLGITGESVWIVPPLSLPMLQPWQSSENARNALNVYGQSESVQLFIARAAATLPDFHLTAQNGAWIVEICRQLDGMPLAIELAAARVRVLSVQQIAERLDDRFHLLTGGSRNALPRQQTLAATLDWSYALLSDAERNVLQRLSIFAGGAPLESVESICAGEEIEASKMLDLLSRLVDQSLVVVDRHQAGETRYRMLETIRVYSRERLDDSGKIGEIYARHLDWFVNVAEQAESELHGPSQGEWLERLARENDNFRVALAWSLENNPVMALRLAGALGQFWYMRGYHFDEGKEWLGKAIARSESSEHIALRAKAFQWLGNLAAVHDDHVMARLAFENSLNLYRNLNDKDGLAQSSFLLADTVALQGDTEAPRFYAMARSYSEESLVSLRKKADKWNLAQALNALGEIARVDEDYGAAHSYYEESLAIRQELGDKRGVAVSFINLGYVAYHNDLYREAAKFFEESLISFQHLGSTRGIVDCLAALAGLFEAEKKPERAARLFGATESLHKTIHAGLTVSYPDRIEYDRSIAAVRSQLAEDTLAALWLEGRSMTLEQAVDYALSDQEIPAPEMSLKERFGGLTAREREAAALIAQGKSNREIAEAMVVGVRTVETYVTRILNKLGFDSRVQIATWAMEKGLSIQRKTG